MKHLVKQNFIETLLLDSPYSKKRLERWKEVHCSTKDNRPTPLNTITTIMDHLNIEYY